MINNIYELSPICNNEVVLENKFRIQECNECPLETVALNSYDGIHIFEKEWLKRVVEKLYDMSIYRFLDEYIYDDVERLKNMYKEYEITLESKIESEMVGQLNPSPMS